jgi:hypothetical protein
LQSHRSESEVLVAQVGGRCYADFSWLSGSVNVLVMTRDVMSGELSFDGGSLGAVAPRVRIRAQCNCANPMHDDRIRAEVVQHNISSTEIINRMRELQFCAGREEEMVHQMLAGGECSLGVALAVFSIIGCRTGDAVNLEPVLGKTQADGGY